MSIDDQLTEIISSFTRTTDILAGDFEPDNVRFLMVAVDVLAKDYETFMGVINDANAWGFCALRIDENDYSQPYIFTSRGSLLHGIWMVGGEAEELLLKIKYTKYVIITLNRERMDQCFKYARMGMPKYPIREKPIDFMERLARVATIQRGLKEYITHP